MGLGDAPDSPSAPPGNTTPLASHDEDEDDLEDDERSSVKDLHGGTVMGQDGDRAVAVVEPIQNHLFSLTRCRKWSTVKNQVNVSFFALLRPLSARQR